MNDPREEQTDGSHGAFVKPDLKSDMSLLPYSVGLADLVRCGRGQHRGQMPEGRLPLICT